MTENTSYDKTIENRQGGKKQILIGILKEVPVVQVACKRAGINRSTFYRWRNEDIDFLRRSNEAMREGIELINDMSESQILQLIKEKKLPAITFWLKNNSPRYGAKTASRGPASPIVELNPKEEALFYKALGKPQKTKHRNKLCRKKSPQKSYKAY